MDLSTYQKLYKRELTKEELLEINSNLTGFIEILIEIDKEQKKDDRYHSIDNSKR